MKRGNVTQATNKIMKFTETMFYQCSITMVRALWFGNFDVKNASRFDRLIIEKVGEIIQKIDQDRHICQGIKHLS